MACYYIVISSTHLRDGQLRSIKGVFRGPIGANNPRATEEADCRLYCELCDKQYVRQQQYENHINSYDHHHKQRLKELKQREFYRALACRRHRRRRREERALRSRHQHDYKRPGECAPGSGPMFRSTTVAVDPAAQSKSEALNWADMRSSSATLGTKPQTSLIQPFLPLDHTLESRLLSNAEWAYGKMDAKSTTSTNPIAEACIVNKSHLNSKQLTAAGDVVSRDQATTINSTKNSQISWTHDYLNTVIPNTDPFGANDAQSSCSSLNKTRENSTTPGFRNTTDSIINSRNPLAHSFPNKVRPVSFSLPKRSCILLHQSAAIFIQAGRGKDPPGRQHYVQADERAKSLQEKRPDEQQKSLITAGVEVVDVDHWDSRNQCGMECNTAIQHSVTGSIMSVEKGNTEPPGHGALASLNNCNEIGVEDSIITSGAEFSLCKRNPTGIHVNQESEAGAHSFSNRGLAELNTEMLSTVLPHNATCSHALLEKHNTEGLFQKAANDLQKRVSDTLTQSQAGDSNPSLLDSPAVHPGRPKEPFCPVLNRDGSRVLLWPTEMLCYTKTSPTISYSINPLLYDFRAHNKAKDGVEGKKGSSEEERERIKPSVIKQPDCQQRIGDTGDGGAVKEDGRKEVDKGGQAGNPMELVAHCSGSVVALDRTGCHDESALKFVPEEGHPALALSREKTSRRRKRRGGVRRGIRKRGRRRRGKKTDKKELEKGRRIIGALCVNQMFEGRAEERLNREGREKGLLSNLAAHRLAGRGEKRIRGEKEWIKGVLAEQERAGRNEEKRGELLSNFSMNRCNRCTQLCVEAKREGCLHLSQQSATGCSPELKKLLSRGTACNLVISPNPGTVIEMPRCPAITPNLPPNDSKAEAINKKAEKEGGSSDDRAWRNPRMEEIRAPQKVKENVCNLAISNVSYPCQDTEIYLVPRPQSEAACHPAIRLVPAPLRETACSQRQTIPAGRGNPVPSLTPHCSEAELRIRSSCADTLPPINNGEISERTQRKRKLPVAETTQRKRRKRGKKANTNVIKILKQGMEKASEGLTSDTRVAGETFCSHDLLATLEINSSKSDTFPGTCSTSEDKAPDCRTKHSDNKERGCDITDNLSNDCSSSNGITQVNVCALVGGEKKENHAMCNTICKENGKINEWDCLNNTINVGERREQSRHPESSMEDDRLQAVSANSCLQTECMLLHKKTKIPTTDGLDPHLKLDDNKTAQSEFDKTKPKSETPFSGSAAGIKTPDTPGCDTVGSSQRECLNGTHLTDYEKVDDNESIRIDRGTITHTREEEEAGRCVKMQQRRSSREKQEVWERLRRKEGEIDFEHLYPEKMPCFPHHLPTPCIPLHTPLILPTPLSSSASSSFSFRHTIIRHHLSILPPPSHHPIPSYPHLFPSFSAHLPPLIPPHAPAPPPPPLHPSFYASPPIPILEAPGPYPVTFHPVQSHHPSLYPSPHPAVLPLQVLF